MSERRHQGEVALIQFAHDFPALRGAMSAREPTTMYESNPALVWKFDTFTLVVYNRRVSIDAVDAESEGKSYTSVIVMEPDWKMPQRMFDHVVASVVGHLISNGLDGPSK